MKILLIATLKENDNALAISNKWAMMEKKALCSMGNDVQELSSKDAVRINFEKQDFNNTDLILFYGHGNTEALIGSDSKPLIDFDNIKCINQPGFYACACHSGKKLGPALINNNHVSFFIGYNKQFRFVYNYEKYFSEITLLGSKILSKDINIIEIEKIIFTLYEDLLFKICEERIAENDHDRKMWLEMVMTALDHNKNSLCVLVNKSCK